MMLLYKAWRESQIRFLAGAAILTLWCLVVVPTARQPYSEYIYSSIFDGLGKSLFELLVMFLGLGGLRRERAHHTVTFTLALPVSRSQVVGAQIVVGLVELAALAILPELLIQPLSGLVHHSYPMAYGLRFALLR